MSGASRKPYPEEVPPTAPPTAAQQVLPEVEAYAHLLVLLHLVRVLVNGPKQPRELLALVPIQPRESFVQLLNPVDRPSALESTAWFGDSTLEPAFNGTFNVLWPLQPGGRQEPGGEGGVCGGTGANRSV